jgi:hypothetical protein
MARPDRRIDAPVSSPRVLFYVSGHGYGHARRCRQVIAALKSVAPEINVTVRTSASPRIFAGILDADRVSNCEVDAGAAERSTLEIDPAGTLDRIEAILARRDAIVAAEAATLGDLRPALIVADIPFLAGDVAEAVGVPCVAMSNFTWDWIAEPFTEALPSRRPLIEAMSRSYAKMEAILRMPLGGVSSAFREVIDVPLVANRAQREPADMLQVLGVDRNDTRPRALFGLRGAIPTQTLASAVRAAPDLLMLCPTNEPGDVPAGVVPVRLGPGAFGHLDFSDVLRVCDVVIGKMGYGLVADCIASGVALLWPRRIGFREDEVVEREGPRVMRMRELPDGDFHAGRWGPHLCEAMALPPPPETMRSDGAEVCAAWIARRVRT